MGIDVAKDRHHAFLGTATGRALLRRLLFDNNQLGFNRLIERACQLQIAHGLDKVVYGLEPTGNYHKPLSSWLVDQDQGPWMSLSVYSNQMYQKSSNVMKFQ